MFTLSSTFSRRLSLVWRGVSVVVLARGSKVMSGRSQQDRHGPDGLQHTSSSWAPVFRLLHSTTFLSCTTQYRKGSERKGWMFQGYSVIRRMCHFDLNYVQSDWKSYLVLPSSQCCRSNLNDIYSRSQKCIRVQCGRLTIHHQLETLHSQTCSTNSLLSHPPAYFSTCFVRWWRFYWSRPN